MKKLKKFMFFQNITTKQDKLLVWLSWLMVVGMIGVVVWVSGSIVAIYQLTNQR